MRILIDLWMQILGFIAAIIGLVVMLYRFFIYLKCVFIEELHKVFPTISNCELKHSADKILSKKEFEFKFQEILSKIDNIQIMDENKYVSYEYGDEKYMSKDAVLTIDNNIKGIKDDIKQMQDNVFKLMTQILEKIK
jgi:hypothetical protein